MATSDISHPVVFTTSTVHKLPPSKYLIPAKWARFQLSQLVNKTLELPEPVPFDFLIRGELLRGSIADWCASHGVKEEETLEIEYFESLMPPKLLSSFDEPEWVGSVSCQRSGLILTGSYDSSIRIYSNSQTVLYSLSGHKGPVTSVCWISSSQNFVSGSHDGTARITPLSSSGDPSLDSTVSLRLHTSAVSSVAANTQGSHVLTASWDGLLGIFTTTIPDEDEVPDDEVQVSRKKKRRVEEPVTQPKRKAPLHILKSHTAKVTRGIFDKSGRQAFSCGFDSTIRTWDTEIGVCTNTINASARQMTDIAIMSDQTTLVAASSDRVVALYDLREKSPSAPPPILPHPAFPSSLAPHPVAPNKVATGAYDGVVRIWDLRSTKSPVMSFQVVGKRGQQTKKKGVEDGRQIMSLDWGNGILAVGGQAGLEVWRANEGEEFTRSL